MLLESNYQTALYRIDVRARKFNAHFATHDIRVRFYFVIALLGKYFKLCDAELQPDILFCC